MMSQSPLRMSTASKPSLNISVLLVDDNETHLYSLCRHLVESGFDVLQAQTGAETLALAQAKRPDIILLDIHLPDMLGFDVCRTLRKEKATSAIPVVFHSATYDTQTARSRATDVGALGFLSYPIDIDHLVSVIRGAVARTRSGYTPLQQATTAHPDSPDRPAASASD